MANLMQLDLRTKGAEARVRSLLEDLIEERRGLYSQYRLALAVWFGRTSSEQDQSVLELLSGISMETFAGPERMSLLWKAGIEGPPFVDIYATSVDHFTKELNSNREALTRYLCNLEVLYFDKSLLNDSVLQAFNVITEPAGLIKGWYVSAEEFSQSSSVRSLLASRGQIKPEIGLVKIQESPDFENCRGLLHAELNQRWLPLTVGGISNFVFYNDLQAGQGGYFLFQGGSVYRIQKFEVKTAPEYTPRVLEKSRDDRYPEVYLRAVQSSSQPAA